MFMVNVIDGHNKIIQMRFVKAYELYYRKKMNTSLNDFILMLFNSLKS
jgi:hypothetical protein